MIKKLEGSVRGLFYSAICIVLLSYISIIAGLFFFQNKLIFPGAASNAANVAFLAQQYPGSRIGFHFDEATLWGWHINKQFHKPIIFYYDGNAGDISYAALQFAPLTQFQSVFVNYRGYGLSTGKPSEEKFYSDALGIFDDLVKRYEPAKIFIIGRSLGSGVATYVASQRKINGLVLVTPFDSITAIGQERYPFAPTALMIKNNFDSLSRAEKLIMPTLVLMAENDGTVPHKNTERLLEKLPDVKDIKILARTNHGNIIDATDYLSIVSDFLQKSDLQ